MIGLSRDITQNYLLKTSIIRSTAGPRMTINMLGNMKKTKGIIILTGVF